MTNTKTFLVKQNTQYLEEMRKKPLLELFEELETSIDGLSEQVAQNRFETVGPNEIIGVKAANWFKQLIDAFANPFTFILLFIAAVTYGMDYLMNDAADRNPISVIIMLSMILLSGIMHFIQTNRQSKASEKLKRMVHTTASVIREGRQYEIALSELVPGDIVYIAAGDMVPGDLRLIQCKDLFVGQSSLTGESQPIEKTVENGRETALFEASNLLFMGTNVISGSGKAIVLLTGSETCFGNLAKKISAKRPLTSFDQGIKSVSLLLIRFMTIMVPLVFFVNGILKKDWISALFFALSVAVGLTPEMLPMIVTINLSKGALSMAKHQTIVKNIHSVQNFGAMDILCTDKTGTITEDRIVLEMHLDVHGHEDARVLRHAFLNSYYQTGLRSLMDEAILDHSKEQDFARLTNLYEKVDEIPFDFKRRRMSVALKNSDKVQIVTKGAVEEMLEICSFAEYHNAVIPLDASLKTEICEMVARLNNEGMRVLAIAQKNVSMTQTVFSIADEKEMILLGYLAFLDPPKDSAKAAITALMEHGVQVKVLTGDNDAVTNYICGKVGIDDPSMILGSDWDRMSDIERIEAVEQHQVFAKLTPDNKSEIVTLLRKLGHTVGFLGDGINDAQAMRVSDVAISVDTAVDIAKESADIILLKKDLTVLMEGVVLGRNIFGNISKYIKMTVSSNFGNMFSVLLASIFLPFLPMLPIQLLMMNLIYDFACIAIPWDRMDSDYAMEARTWSTKSIRNFIFWIGPISSIFDVATYLILYFYIAPIVAPVNTLEFQMAFHTGWFIESLCSQMLIIHMIRTKKVPFFQSSASFPVVIATLFVLLAAIILPLTTLGNLFGMVPLPLVYYPILLIILVIYFILTQLVKTAYIRLYGQWL